MKLIEHEIDSLPVVREVVLENGEKACELIGRVTKTTIQQDYLLSLG